MGSLKDDNIQLRHTYEHTENDVADEDHVSPKNIPSILKDVENPILHLHSSGDWISLLQSLPSDLPVIQTIHDAEPLTGGCAYPLDCPHFDKNCADPCPRNFQNSEALRKVKVQLLERADILVTPSRWMSKLIKKAVPSAKVRVIPNGVPWQNEETRIPERKAQAKESLGLPVTTKTVLFIAHGGASAVYKSGPKWLDYYSKIKEQHPETVGFAVGGDISHRKGDLFTWPYVDREKLRTLMYAADVLIYPTLADNHPLVILEAMSCGLATVSFAVGGVPEQIIHNETGYLVPEHDDAGFIDTALKALSPQNARRLGLNAHHSGRNRFSVERMASGYKNLYKQICHKHYPHDYSCS